MWLGDAPVATLRPRGGGVDVYNIHTDHLNTPRVITDSITAVVRWRWDGGPFGTGAANDDPSGVGAFEFDLRFPGQIAMTETGLHYNYYRDGYDPITGRYTQSDPIGLRGGLNTYGYASANPIGIADPSGLAPNLSPYLPDANITCCVNGQMTICMNHPENKNWQCQVISDSLRVHEESHLGEFQVKSPKICVGVSGRRAIGYSTWNEWKLSEIAAFNAQLDFLAKRKREACLSSECEDEVRRMIEWILYTAIPGVTAGTYGH